MSVRRLITGVATTSLVAAVLAVSAPAQADPAFAPDADDIVGSGSDTSMFAMQYIAEGVSGFPGYNASSPAARLVTWEAKILDAAGAQTNSATITPRAGAAAITRPNGSTEGKNQLNGAGNNTAFNFARSSSGLSAGEVSAGLFNFPFAKDTLALATAKVSNAPASISPADMVKIYNGTHDEWSDLGGSPGFITPKIPQAGSGTRAFFVAQLQAANGGVAVVLAPSVREVQEHDPTQIEADANAVAPFSIGRNTVDGSPLAIKGGFSAARALYNVVRQADLGNAGITAIFGKDGYVCSPAAKPLIEAAGFEQLASAAAGGVCGVPSQTSTSNLTTTVGDAKIATATTLTGTSTAIGALSLTATVSASIAPLGLVSFYVDGATTPAATTTLSGGKAIASLSKLTGGAHSVVAKYTPTAKSAFAASDSAATSVTVLAPAAKATTKLVEKFKKSYAKAKSYKGKIVLKESATGAPTGKVVVKLGKKTVGKGKIKSGKVTLTVKKLKKGKNKLTATFAGTSTFAASKLKFTITVK